MKKREKIIKGEESNLSRKFLMYKIIFTQRALRDLKGIDKESQNQIALKLKKSCLGELSTHIITMTYKIHYLFYY